MGQQHVEDKCRIQMLFLLKDDYQEKVLNVVSGAVVRDRYPNAEKIELIEMQSFYYEVGINVPANDQHAQIEKAFSAYKEEMGIVEFATAKVNTLEDVVIIYDVHFNRFIKLDRKEILVNSEYKPYNQYHKNIDRVVRSLTQRLESDLNRNKLVNAIINTCNFEKEGKEYSFILLWSSLESLFRSNQYPTAITAIKDIVPNILAHRYIYYRLFDFLKDCYNIGVQYSYQEVEMVVENPSAREIGLLFTLLRDETEKEIFLQICRNTYVMQS